MKRIILCILFILAAVWSWNREGEYPASEKLVVQTEETEAAQATRHVDQIISVLVAANSCADLSVRTTNTISVSIVRRYRPGDFSFDRLFGYLAEGQDSIFENAIKTTSGLSQEYAARLKNEGYYLYALRKIII